MSFADIFYSDNPGRRRELARLGGVLGEKINMCFKAVNKLIECIESDKSVKFEKIAMDKSRSIGENCDIIIKRINEINKYIERKRSEIKMSLGTELFEKVMSTEDVTESTLRTWVSPVPWIGFIITDFFLVRAMKNGRVFVSLVQRLGVIKASVVATLGLAVLFLAADLILSAIFGKLEKKQLEQAIKEYEDVISEFEPLVDGFYDEACMLRSKLSR